MNLSRPERHCVTGKTCYSEAGARAVLVGIVMMRNRGNQARRENRAYDCPECSWWHLTSKPKPKGEK